MNRTMSEGPIDTAAQTAQELKALLVERIDWIPKKLYMELYGESDEVLKKRCRPGGGWQRGVHFNKPAGGGLWISVKAVNAWAAGVSSQRTSSSDTGQDPSG